MEKGRSTCAVSPSMHLVVWIRRVVEVESPFLIVLILAVRARIRRFARRRRVRFEMMTSAEPVVEFFAAQWHRFISGVRHG